MEILMYIEAKMAVLTEYIEALDRALARIDEAGRYRQVPKEAWQTRGNATEYLYMMFPFDRSTGRHSGPNGVRKLYVGVKDEKIADARRLALNCGSFHVLTRKRQMSHGVLTNIGHSLTSLKHQLESHTRSLGEVDLDGFGDDEELQIPEASPQSDSSTGGKTR